MSCSHITNVDFCVLCIVLAVVYELKVYVEPQLCIAQYRLLSVKMSPFNATDALKANPNQNKNKIMTFISHLHLWAQNEKKNNFF